jgi:hypothetical protein
MNGPPQVFSLNAGYWDVPGAQTSYPTLRTGSINPLAGQVRLQKVLVAYGVGLTVSFADLSIYKTVQQYVQTAQRVPNVGINVFGFNFGVSTNGQYSRNISQISMSSNSNTGFINLAPTPAGVFVLLGAYGTKM